MQLNEFNKDANFLIIENNRGHVYKVSFDDFTGKIKIFNYETERETIEKGDFQIIE